MSSTIIFKYSYSCKSVNFLDTTVKLEPDGTLSTSLYYKTTARHYYLHNQSYHEPHLIKSVPKSQFIRLRRICTHMHDYTKHVNEFITFFQYRGYDKTNLIKCAYEVKNMKREDLLSPKPPSTQTNEQPRVPLVIHWHHKFQGIAKTIHNHFARITKAYPSFKEVFPEPPIVAYRRAKNLKDRIVKAKHWNKSNTNHPDSSSPTTSKHKSKLDPSMNPQKLVTNTKSSRSCQVAGGNSSSSNVIYSAECTRHNKLYVGMTGGKLSTRFSGHRSDVKLRPERCELPKHFHEEKCDFSNDLKVTVLEHVKGTEATRLYLEDKWITRLGTLSPNGLNTSKSEFASIHKSLFAP